MPDNEISELRSDIKLLSIQMAVLSQKFSDLDIHRTPCSNLCEHITTCHTNGTMNTIKEKAITTLVNALIVGALAALWIGFSAKVGEANNEQRSMSAVPQAQGNAHPVGQHP